MARFIPKIIRINGSIIQFVQSSLSIKMGYGETNVRTQVSGRNTTVVSSENLDTAIAEVSFDMVVSDTGDSVDIRRLVQGWKANSGANTIFIESDGAGVSQNFVNMSLTIDPVINEAPDGNLSLTFMGERGQLN